MVKRQIYHKPFRAYFPEQEELRHINKNLISTSTFEEPEEAPLSIQDIIQQNLQSLGKATEQRSSPSTDRKFRRRLRNLAAIIACGTIITYLYFYAPWNQMMLLEDSTSTSTPTQKKSFLHQKYLEALATSDNTLPTNSNKPSAIESSIQKTSISTKPLPPTSEETKAKIQQQKMQSSKREAIRLKAQSISDFSLALKREKEAWIKFKAKEYQEALALFERASRLYTETTLIRLRQLQIRTKVVKNAAREAKEIARQAQAHLQATQIFQEALQIEQKADQFFQQQEYIASIKHYQKAKDTYSLALRKTK